MPLTVGGGIRDMVDGAGVKSSALRVADAYFRAGADKVSIGSDAVEAARAWLRDGVADGSTSIEQISRVYGRQARDDDLINLINLMKVRSAGERCPRVPGIVRRRAVAHTSAHRCHV